jgi:hypothetical protein
MAARMNMLKLLQETEGFATFSSRRPQNRPAPALILQFRPMRFRANPSTARRTLRIDVQEPVDVGTRVPIRYKDVPDR